jgi:TolB-like protein/Tfp pilus assembly protein PilF
VPDIFLSYSRDDQAIARRFADGFERAGLGVWWDQTLNAGEDYDEVTERALAEARAVVVLWSAKSVSSRWVRAEATQADRNGTLVPVMVEDCKRPIMFELKQTADLSGWSGDPHDSRWQALLASVRRLVAKDATPAAVATPPITDRPRRNSSRTAVMAVLALMVVAAAAWLVGRKGSVPVAPASPAASVAASEVTLAVLPFANLSSDPEQEYFSDGLTEEILNQLAQISALRVTGRTSSFSFKGKNEDLRVIGEKLGVANLLEGSIRKDGNQLRIIAQLINSKDGAHLWSQTYARELKDVFAIQEEIAKDVARVLRIRLDVGDMPRAQGGTTNLEAYDKFLRAQTAYRRADPLAATQFFREATALDPNFWRAWFGLRSALGVIPSFLPERVAEARAELIQVREHLVQAAPDSWAKQLMLTGYYFEQRKWMEAEAAMKAALSGMPASEVDGRMIIAQTHAQLGRFTDSLVHYERVLQLDPGVTMTSMQLQFAFFLVGRPADAQAEFERSHRLPGSHAQANVPGLYRAMATGDAQAVREFMRTNAADMDFPKLDVWQSLLGKVDSTPAEREAAIWKVLREPANQSPAALNWITIFAGQFGGKEAALDAMRRLKDLGIFSLYSNLWADPGARTDPRFKEILRSTGLVDYFRLTGKWADFCKPVGADDFECYGERVR